MLESVSGPRTSVSWRRPASLVGSPRGARLAVALAAVVSTLSFAPNASAEAEPGNDDNEASYAPPPPQRRGGFTFGVTPSLTLSHYGGSLNELSKLDDPAFHESTTSLGFGVTTWFGGALRDWFTFGLGFSMNSTFGEPQGLSSAYLLRLEGFPAYSLGGAYRDLGVAGEFGLATGVLQRDGDDVAEGGDMSHVAFSVFYEPLRLWKLSMGPAVSYAHDFSQSLTVNTFSLGWRVVFYGSPGAQ